MRGLGSTILFFSHSENSLCLEFSAPEGLISLGVKKQMADFLDKSKWDWRLSYHCGLCSVV